MRSQLAAAVSVAAALMVVSSLVGAESADASPQVLHVGATQTYKTIQSAVDASTTGDVIDIDDGTYTENVTISNKWITLTGDLGAPANVVLTAAVRNSTTGTSPLFLSGSSVSSHVVIEGMTITNGLTQSGQGGGVTIHQSNAELRHDVITGNSAPSGYGGGILVDSGSAPYIHDNVISANSASQGGGGVFAFGSNAVVADNTITGNSTTGAVIPNGGSAGGGIYLETSTGVSMTVTIFGNTISDNNAEFAGGGIMVRTGVTGTIEDNLVHGNSAAYGGGIHVETNGSAITLDGNTISGNAAIHLQKFDSGGNTSGWGGGISIYGQSHVTAVRNRVTGNSAPSGGAGVVAAEQSVYTLSADTISSNIVGSGATTESPPLSGGGLYAANSTGTVTNTLFVGNSADIGGAIGLLDGATATIDQNTIVGNHEAFQAGGAVFVVDASTVSASLENNILSNNDGYQLFDPNRRAARISNNLFGLASSTPAQMGAGAYFAFHGTQPPYAESNITAINNVAGFHADGNIEADPGFTNAASGDYSIAQTSAAIDHATVVGVPQVTTDHGGDYRLTPPPDIGAFEYQNAPVSIAQPTISGTAAVGATLTAVPGTWGTIPASWTYQWLRGGTVIPDATAASYVPTTADVGSTLSVTATGTKFGITNPPTTSLPSATVGYFIDVPSSNPFFAAINWMASSGLSIGTRQSGGGALYKPVDSVSRQAMAAFLYRLSGQSFTAPVDPTFADVDSSSSFYTAIEWMAAQGISTGTTQPSGKPLFKPGDSVSREVMAIFLARYAHVDTSTAPTVQSFADVPLTANSAAAISWMASTGISTGTAQPSGLPLYKPQDPVSRQAMAAFLQRLSNLH